MANNSPGICSNLWQALIFVILAVLFFYFFGLSTFAKWEREDVQVVTRRFAGNTLQLPAITVCGSSAADHQTWKNSKGSGFSKCKNQTDVVQCVMKNTFTVDEVIEASHLFTRTKESNNLTMKQFNWTSSMTKVSTGMCHTMVYEKNTTTKSHIKISSKKNLTIFLHDPKFFILTHGNFFLPFLRLEAQIGKGFKIAATNIRRMNRPNKFDCNTDPNYNFRECVRMKISNSQGCVSPWDHKTTDTLPTCSNVSSLNNFAVFYRSAYQSSSREELEELTGCLLPCSYTRYRLADTRVLRFSSDAFSISYASTEQVTEEEVLLFPLDSLVSELGGALGLFLGFSFFGAVSVVEGWIRNLLQVISSFRSPKGPLQNQQL